MSTLKHRVDIDTMVHQAATSLNANEIGVVNLSLERPLVCEAYRDDRELGSFILIDPLSHKTAAAGIIDFALRRADDIRWHTLDVDKALRARIKQQRPCVLWLTGLSGAGKSTIANLVEKRLSDLGLHTYLLDGDNLRHGLNRDLGFTDRGAGREHPPRRRNRTIVRRRRPDRAGVADLAVPIGARDGARPARSR